MTSLYELTQDELRLLAEIDELANPEPDENGVISDTTGKLGELIQTQMQGEAKIETLIRVIEYSEHRAKVQDADYKAKKDIIERARLEARRCENTVDRIKSRILWRMDALGQSEIEAGVRRLKIIGTKGRVEIAPDAKFSLWPDLPTPLYRVEYVPDKMAIYNEFKDSEQKPHGVEIIPGRRLAIK